MAALDERLTKLRQIYSDFGTFCQGRGKVSETDTRVKVIDRILKEVLGWSEDEIVREEKVHSGFVDYRLSPSSRAAIILEAKKEGIAFELPRKLEKSRRYRLQGAIKTSLEIEAAVKQVQQYCSDEGVRNAIITNGYSWIVFRAIRDDQPWRTGEAIVFSGAKDILENFLEFWNLFAKENVASKSLEEAFTNWTDSKLVLERPLEQIFDRDAPLARNRLHVQLNPIIEFIFRELSKDEQVEVLERCYVYGRTLDVVEKDLNVIIKDSMPKFAEQDGTQHTTTGKNSSGRLGDELVASISNEAGRLFLLLGGVGSGKTTFLHRFVKITGKDALRDHSVLFRVDFLSAPIDLLDADKFVYETILKQIRERYSALNLESRASLFSAFQDIFEQKIALYGDDVEGKKRAEAKVIDVIEKAQRNPREYVQRLLKNLRKMGRVPIVFIDNVDQLEPKYQNNIFLLAQNVMREFKCVVIVALREESYYSAKSQKVLTAYSNSSFHIASPPLGMLLKRRMEYCKELLSKDTESIRLQLHTQGVMDFQQIKNFLDIVETSILFKNHNIVKFIEYLSFGNMREALEMFSTFLYSGSTNVDKMLNIFEKTGRYNVAFHEFSRSVMLGDRKYYRESQSKVANMFERTSFKNNSHFTGLRLLGLLVRKNSAYSPEGKGFVSLEDVLQLFDEEFDNEKDITEMILKLALRQIVELDTKQLTTLADARYLRITSAGVYYYKYLIKAFTYLDLVQIDTPIEDPGVVKSILALTRDIEEQNTHWSPVEEKLATRFERVEVFLNYLEKCENEELKSKGTGGRTFEISERFVPGIRTQYILEKNWILERIKGNSGKPFVDEPQYIDEADPDLTKLEGESNG